MAKRDPIKTARNKVIGEMTDQLKVLLPLVLAETGMQAQSSLNAMIGGKAAEFIDLHHELMHNPDDYVQRYMEGFRRELSPPGLPTNAHRRNFELIKASPAAREYFLLFLRRSFLKHYEEYSRTRPDLSASEIWIGQNKADYGLLITPRYRNGVWENDRSEIRHFPKLYWTIGHVLQSGLVVDGDSDPITFKDVDQYLTFFKNTLVRASGSPYEKQIANLYVAYVRAAEDPESVPLLIPEFRYDGKASAHKYRLDFTIINPFTMDKVGYELSPWSTHGYLAGTKALTQKQINDMAKDNFEGEMAKHRAFFKKHDIFSLIYTDKNLANIQSIFDDMKRYLAPVNKVKQLDLNLINGFFEQ